MSIRPNDQLARQFLVDILRQNGPQLGAKLKVRLTTALGTQLGYPKERWSNLIPKLSYFLAANSDLVEVVRPSAGPGDLSVSLRDDPQGVLETGVEPSKVWYRPDVWTAFINPDPNRRRFFHRQSHEIVHYTSASATAPNPQLEERVAKDPQFAEISFASGDLQRQWLRDFLDTTPQISESHKKVARHFLDLPFDSSLNMAFAASLGPHGEAWKRFRVKKVDELVIGWAGRIGIDVETLKQLPVTQSSFPIPPLGTVATQVESHTSAPAVGLTERGTLLRLLEALNEAELRMVLVPLSAVDRLLRQS